MSNMTFTNATTTTLVSTNATSTNFFSSLLTTVTGFFTNLTVTNASTTNLSAVGFTGTNGIFTGTLTASTSLNVLGTLNVTGQTNLFNASSSNLTTGNLFVSGVVSFATTTISNLTVTGTTSLTNTIFTNATSSKLTVQSMNSTPQMILSYDNIRTTTFQTDAVGNMTIITSGGSVFLNQNNFFVCVSSACPSSGYSMTSAGNLLIEKKVIAEKFEQICPTGYIWTPGSAKYGTLPGFCVMKYNAKNVGGVATSQPTGSPWVSINQSTALATCTALGMGYHLLSEPEYMTIATNIMNTTINNLNTATTTLQLATGHSDNAPANALETTAGADPIVSGCNLNLPLGNAANAYVASSCELRGNTTSYLGTDNDKGYYGTGNYFNQACSSGLANSSQLRTHVLSNGNVIWDMAGNVWQWTDAWLVAGNENPLPQTGWIEYNTITDYKGLNYLRSQTSTLTSVNGIGQMYSWSGVGTVVGFIRGGGWSYGALSGLFALTLYDAPSDVYTTLGFRCAR